MVEVGDVCGVCSKCGKEICRPRPADVGVCDCSEYCPQDHGKGPYGTVMEDYTPDLTPSTYGPIKVENGATWGDTKHPMHILKRCPTCNYLSTQLPVEVKLS